MTHQHHRINNVCVTCREVLLDDSKSARGREKLCPCGEPEQFHQIKYHENHPNTDSKNTGNIFGEIVRSGVSIDVKENTDCYVDGSCSLIIDMSKIKRQIQALVEQQVLIGRKAELLKFLDIWHNNDSFGTSDFSKRLAELDRQISKLKEKK